MYLLLAKSVKTTFNGQIIKTTRKALRIFFPIVPF